MKALFFDVDDTLYDQRQPFERAFYKHYPDRTDIDTDKLFVLSRIYSDEVFLPSQRGEISMEEMYIYRIHHALRDMGIAISDEKALAFQYDYAGFQHHLIMSPVMKELFERLKKRDDLILGVITNGSADHQMEKIKGLGIDAYMDERNIIISGAMGCMKPDREIFDLAAERAGLPLAECYFIGDSVTNDIEGAHKAGWKTVWFNRRNHEEEGIPADDIFHKEEELADFLLTL